MSGRSPPASNRSIDILLVESSPDDIAPLVDSFEATELTNEVHVVSDGDTALDFLCQRGEHAGVSRPDIVVLDLQVRGTGGEEILNELNGRPELRPIPVLVMTKSDKEEDVNRSYELDANAYVHKPDTADELDQLAQAIEDFWFNAAKMPPK